MTMKKLIYFLALEAALLLGASCDKESDNVPLYVNTWVTDSKSLLTFGGKSVDYGFYQINADKTFNLSFLANENVLEVLKTQILPRLEPSEKDDDDYIDEATVKHVSTSHIKFANIGILCINECKPMDCLGISYYSKYTHYYR